MSLVLEPTIASFVHLNLNGQTVLLRVWVKPSHERCGLVEPDGFGIAPHAKSPTPASEKVTVNSSVEHVVNCFRTDRYRTLNEIA